MAGVLWLHNTVTNAGCCLWHWSEDRAVGASAVPPGLAAMTTALLGKALCGCSCRELRVIDILSVSQDTAGSRDPFLWFCQRLLLSQWVKDTNAVDGYLGRKRS